MSAASGGTLTAGSGVSIVDATAGTHYNGSSFVSGSGAYYLATAGSTSAWTFPLAGAQLASGHSYGVTLKTIDSGGECDDECVGGVHVQHDGAGGGGDGAGGGDDVWGELGGGGRGDGDRVGFVDDAVGFDVGDDHEQLGVLLQRD